MGKYVFNFTTEHTIEIEADNYDVAFDDAWYWVTNDSSGVDWYLEWSKEWNGKGWEDVE